ncbi:MAG: hypothetical protein AABZ47_09485 [Planctomycetota bacterium]
MLLYVLISGARATAWANVFQTVIFVAVGIITFVIIGQKLGGFDRATQLVKEHNPTMLKREALPADHEKFELQTAAFEKDPKAAILKPHKPQSVSQREFLSYGLIPLSVAMFPHLFQLWLTAKTAKKFRLTVIAHPILIMVVWLPCVLIGVWATSAIFDGKPVIPSIPPPNPNTVLAIMVKSLAPPALAGLLAAGVLAAILGGLDAQFLCLGTMFTHDVVSHYRKRNPLTDSELLRLGRFFVIVVVIATYILALLLTQNRGIFKLGVWCFSGFSSLFPLVFAALYWKGVTKAGAIASILAAGGTWTWLFVQSNYGSSSEMVFGMVPAATILPVTVVALVFVSLITRRPSQQTLEKFFEVATVVR